MQTLQRQIPSTSSTRQVVAYITYASSIKKLKVVSQRQLSIIIRPIQVLSQFIFCSKTPAYDVAPDRCIMILLFGPLRHGRIDIAIPNLAAESAKPIAK